MCLLAPSYAKMKEKHQDANYKQIEVEQQQSELAATTFNSTKTFMQTALVSHEEYVQLQPLTSKTVAYPPLFTDTSKAIAYLVFSRPPPFFA